jgi:prophage maintenance system killer protein
VTVRVGWHPRRVNEPSEGRYRDREDSRFYRAAGLSPEDTWEVLSQELARVLGDAQEAFWRKPVRMDAERVHWWHGAIFARHFPYEGGKFREERAFFGLDMPGGGMRQLEGAEPAAIRRELAAVCAEFNRRVEEFGEPDKASVLDRIRAAAALYAGILRVHPFPDGNHRAGFVALSAALWSLGLPNVEFASDEEMLAHDAALVPGLLDRDSEPFARLLADRIERARKDTT